jgi:hypothetical protein
MSLTSSSPVRFFWLSDSFPGLMISCLACTGGTGLMRLIFLRAGRVRAPTALAALVAPAVSVVRLQP